MYGTVPMMQPGRVSSAEAGGSTTEETAGLSCPAACRFGQAPVHHLDFAVGADHDVVGLEVAVDHLT
jgi:hypothetical protein